MGNYDFKQLSPSDFEDMSRDLLQAEMSITFESFVTGRDGGIDFRYAKNKNLIVVQCKHYIKTGVSGLMANLRQEVSKVISLKPNRYIVVTSVALTPKNKKDIVELIGNKFLCTSDIFGQDDLNNLLTKHKNIENNHYKLWLSSRAVLDRVINNALITHSEFKVDQIYKEIPRYVPSSSFPDALKILDENRVVIIAGSPGVGKTTLANLLLYEHLEKGFQAVIIESDIRDAKSLIQKGINQIFYFDDFFGATYLGENGISFRNNADQVFIDFISMVRTSASTRLVLTTREHIMNLAVQQSERIRFSDMSDHKLILKISDYSVSQRARILYNHLYFSDLPSQYTQALLQNSFYLEIVKHIKFNPRLIEWLSTYRRVKDVDVFKYIDFIKNLLNNPAEIWMHAYEQQISNAARSFLLALFTHDGKANLNKLESSFSELHKVRGIKYGFPLKPNDFQTAFKELTGAFIKIESLNRVQVLDPSVLDLCNEVIKETPENIIDLLNGVINFDQINKVWSFANSANNLVVLKKLVENPTVLSSNLERVMYITRKNKHSDGITVYTGATFEERLSVLIDMADNIQSPDFLELIKNLYVRLKQEWQTEHVHIEEGVSILRAFNRVTWSQIDDLSGIYIECRDTLVNEASYGCESNTLRDLISALDSFELNEPEVSDALKNGFVKYLQENFLYELQESKSSSQFDSLLGNLNDLQTIFGVDAEYEKGLTLTAQQEFEENESAYSDHMHDEWKDQYYESLADEEAIHALFDSLILE